MKRSVRWLIAGLLGLIIIGTALYCALTADLPAPESLLAHASIGSTKIVDRNGQLLYAMDARSCALHAGGFGIRPART